MIIEIRIFHICLFSVPTPYTFPSFSKCDLTPYYQYKLSEIRLIQRIEEVAAKIKTMNLAYRWFLTCTAFVSDKQDYSY